MRKKIWPVIGRNRKPDLRSIMPKKWRPKLEELGDRVVPAVTISFNAGILTVTGDGANDTITIRSDAATGNILVNSVGTGHSLTDTFGLVVNGNGGNDNISASGLNVSFFTSNPTFDGGDGNDSIVGTARIDIMSGGLGNDSMRGLAGNDLIDGGAGNDTLSGGDGNDLFIGGDGTLDRLSESGNVNFTLTNTALTGLGTDTVGGIEQADLTGGAGINTINAEAFGGQVTLNGGAGADVLRGSDNSDLLIGGDGIDTFFGNDGDDSILGGGGADIMNGNAGNDTMTGGSGNDANNGGAGADVVRETLASLVDTFLVTNNVLNGNGIDAMTNVEAVDLTGSAANELFVMTEFNGQSTLRGGGGIDRLTAVLILGDDATLSNTLFTRTGAGNTVLDSIERAYLDGGVTSNNINASAFTGNVTITGGIGNDTLIGGSGADVIDGGLGNDFVDGGLGNDTLRGAAGDDEILAGAGNDSIDGGLGTDRLFGLVTGANATLTATSFNGQGTDTLASIERATITGNGGNNNISALNFGNSVILNGLGGNDTLTGSNVVDGLNGGDGDDDLIGKEGSDVLNGGNGQDRVIASYNADYVLTDTGLAIDKVGIGGTSVDDLISIERASLTGGDSNNRLDAGAFNGQATLDGGAGKDTLVGGSNDDSLVGGSGDDNMSGGGGNDRMNGQSGNDNIQGGSGDDDITGSFGNDTIAAGTGTDTFREGFASATNKTFSVSDTAAVFTDNGVNLGTDALSGFERLVVTMSAGNNAIFAGNFSGQATLTGGTGNDRIAGSRGNDVINGGGGVDTVRFLTVNDITLTNTQSTGEGTDSLVSIENADIEGLAGNQRFDATAFTGRTTMRGGAGNDTLLGGTNVDNLFGDAGNDRLEGRDGNDFLTGGAGADSLLGGNGDDSANSDFQDFVDLGPGN